MKQLLLPLVGVSLLLLTACSDPQEAPTAAQNEVAVHGEGWLDPTSANFHGKVLAAQNYDAKSCRPCHGSQFDGGLVKSSCRKCHVTYPHPPGWVEAASPNFHGKTLAGVNYNLNLCNSCHGSQFDGGTSGVSCRTCHASYPHPADWMNPASTGFHGTVLAAQNYNATACRACHGAEYAGGTSGVSCKRCHASYPHPQNWIAGPAAHSTFLKNNGYDLNSCQACHGRDYSLVKGTLSCLTCHTQQNGPEACNTCHGNPAASAADLKNAAPPKGLDDETEATSPAVGAHQAHLAYYTELSTATVCQECHVLPASFAVPDHIDDNSRAEAVFTGALGTRRTEGGARVPQVVYDFNNNTCSNSYCHGNWALRKAQSPNDFGFAAEVMTGNNAAPSWVNSGSAPCGSCHGLPPTGHTPFAITACTICHQGVVDGFGNITDSSKHINGKVNVLGREYDMY